MPIPNPLRRHGLWLGLAICAPLIAGAAPAPVDAPEPPEPKRVLVIPTHPAFPTDTSPNGVADWILKNIDADGLTLVTAGPKLSVWVTPDIDRENAPRVRYWERQEILDAKLEAELGARSLRVEKQIDCDRKLVRILFTARYAANNLQEFKDSTGGEERSTPITPEMHETREMALICPPPRPLNAAPVG
ncbi:MAG: hypothetical protein ABIO39_07770 [Caulobacteraceae bacterium]